MHVKYQVNWKPLESGAVVSESLVQVRLYIIQQCIDMQISRAEHEKFRLKTGGPSSKPKYYLMTDSEQVPRGKGEKNPEQGSEIDLKSNTYNQS